jgi:hypothetical protein
MASRRERSTEKAEALPPSINSQEAAAVTRTVGVVDFIFSRRLDYEILHYRYDE